MSANDLGPTRKLPETGGFELAATTSIARVVLEDEAGARHEPASETFSIGAHGSNHLVLESDAVSRFHCEVRIDGRRVRVVDLGSKNGTFVDGVRVESAFLEPGNTLRVGDLNLRVGVVDQEMSLELHPDDRLGPMVGRSVAMRRVFTVLDKVAGSDATVLLLGESGTGKELAAAAVHERSARSAAPFVVLDCGAIPPTLLESELFGSEKGAYTGATESRAGVFEEANGGTIFLDEVGELPLDLQPKLLRVLEQRTVKRLGGSGERVDVDVRILAATNRDLRVEVNEGRFRPDLYYRLAVVTVELPPLRRRLDDVPALVEKLLERMRPEPAVREKLLDPLYLERLQRYPWPGNVRELRNVLTRAAAFEEAFVPSGPAGGDDGAQAWLPPVTMSYADARSLAIERFERRWLEALLREHRGKVAQAARAAGMARGYLHRLIRRHGLRSET